MSDLFFLKKIEMFESCEDSIKILNVIKKRALWGPLKFEIN